jgi:hypothetical protein
MRSYGFGNEEVRRISNAVKKVEASAGQGGENRVDGTPVIQLIRITSTLDEATGLYEGTVITYNHVPPSVSENDLGEVRVFYEHDRIRFKVGNVILCRFSGNDESGEFGMFVPCHKFKIIEVVTDVNCVEGEIVCDYAEIVVLDFDIEPEEE